MFYHSHRHTAIVSIEARWTDAVKVRTCAEVLPHHPYLDAISDYPGDGQDELSWLQQFPNVEPVQTRPLFAAPHLPFVLTF